MISGKQFRTDCIHDRQKYCRLLTDPEQEAGSTLPLNTVEISLAHLGVVPEDIKESNVIKIEEQAPLDDIKTDHPI